MDYIELELVIFIALLNGLLLASLASFLLKNRLKQWIFGMADEKFVEILKNIAENPDVIVGILKPALPKLFEAAKNQLGGNEGKPSGDLRIGGFKIPGWLAEYGMKFLGKKFLGEASEAVSASPFG